MSVLANFHADLIHDADDPTRVEDCAIRLQESTLTLGGDAYEAEIETEEIFDIRIGPPPMSVAGEFNSKTLTIAVETERDFGERSRDVYFLSGNDSGVDHFGQLLFRTVLNGTEVAVRHPAEIGGRRTNAAFTIGELALGERNVGFSAIDVPFKVDIDSIIDFSTDERELLGERREIINVQYVRDGRSIVFEAALSPDRKRYLLGRYLRLEYSKLQRELANIDLSAPETKALATLYTMHGRAKLQTLLSGRSESSIKVLKLLQKRGLVNGEEGYVELTPKGWIMITTRFDQADAEQVTDGSDTLIV